jgi:FHA domain
MLLIEKQPTPTTPQFNAASNLRLRIRSAGVSQPLVELRQGKTTIGSSPRCDIRILQPGVQPLHCLILCEGGVLSVRRWAAGTRLNGQPFDEAPFGPGDRLTVAEVELELDCAGAEPVAEESKIPWSERAATSEVEPSSSQPGAPSIDSWGEWSSTQLTQLSEERQNQEFPQSTGADSVAPKHNAAWPEQWGTPQVEGEQSQGRLTVFHEQLSQLEEKLASWKDAREDWQKERSEWRAEREQSQEHWGEMERQIAVLQVRASEIVGRIERLEHSMAAQALVPKFESPRVEFRPFEPQTEPIVESPATLEPAKKSSSSIDEPASPAAGLAVEPKPEADDELAPFAEFSIWRQGATSTTPASDESAFADYPSERSENLAPQPAAGPASSPGENVWQVAPAKSFIEHYGYMFADDDVVGDEPSAAPVPAASRGTADIDSIIRKPQNAASAQPEGITLSATASEEEESIEQYMSKLLQRVRGDQPGASASQSMSPGLHRNPTSATTAGPSAQSVASTNDHPRTGADGDWLTTSLGTVRRKAPIIEQPADRQRLRAVANESARRAIGTYSLRVHRRNAITKVIVSTLAGMTSLLMMLSAPHWQDLQFITACVALIVAAYWAGQTYAELIDAFRAAAYDGPVDQLQGFAEPLPGVLPTAVESSATS